MSKGRRGGDEGWEATPPPSRPSGYERADEKVASP
jgi:hypothetical protein